MSARPKYKYSFNEIVAHQFRSMKLTMKIFITLAMMAITSALEGDIHFEGFKDQTIGEPVLLSLTFTSNPEPNFVKWFVHDIDHPIRIKYWDYIGDYEIDDTRTYFNSSFPYEFYSLRVSFVVMVFFTEIIFETDLQESDK